MKKAIWNTFVILYAIIAIFVTICLLSYNEHRITELGDHSLVIIDSRDLEPEFSKGNLVITDKSYKPEVGEKVFFYNTSNPEVTINVAKIVAKEEYSSNNITYTLEGNKIVKSENILGPVDKASNIKMLGTILGVLESKWGFLVLIVLPSLIAFLYEVSEVISELRNGKKESNKKTNEK